MVRQGGRRSTDGLAAAYTTDAQCHVCVDVEYHNYLHNPHCGQLNRGLLSGHPMGDHSRLLPTSLVLLLIISILLPLSQPQLEPELESESSLKLVSTKSGGVIDVADWRIGDVWIYDAEFDVEEDATKAQIKRAFVKSLKTKKLNKKVLGEFISLVA